MTHTDPGRDSPAPRIDRPRTPPTLRLLGALGLAALLVALYALVRIVSSGDEAAGTLPTSGTPTGGGLPIITDDPPDIGALAPDIVVPTLDGGEFSLSEHLAGDGRPVFVNMWAEWCFPCRAEMPAIDALSQRHPEVHFIGIVVRDGEAPARAFVEEFSIGYQIGLDLQRKVEADYGVWVMPTTYLIGANGLVIDRVFGPMVEAQLEALIAKALPSS